VGGEWGVGAGCQGCSVCGVRGVGRQVQVVVWNVVVGVGPAQGGRALGVTVGQVGGGMACVIGGCHLLPVWQYAGGAGVQGSEVCTVRVR